MVNVISVP